MSKKPICPMCDNTGYLDYCGFCMDVCPCAGFAAERAETLAEDRDGNADTPESDPL